MAHDTISVANIFFPRLHSKRNGTSFFVGHNVWRYNEFKSVLAYNASEHSAIKSFHKILSLQQSVQLYPRNGNWRYAIAVSRKHDIQYRRCDSD